MIPADRMVLAYLLRQGNERTRKAIVERTGLTKWVVEKAFIRLRKRGYLEGWAVTESGRREICPARMGP